MSWYPHTCIKQVYSCLIWPLCFTPSSTNNLCTSGGLHNVNACKLVRVKMCMQQTGNHKVVCLRPSRSCNVIVCLILKTALSLQYGWYMGANNLFLLGCLTNKQVTEEFEMLFFTKTYCWWIAQMSFMLQSGIFWASILFGPLNDLIMSLCWWTALVWDVISSSESWVKLHWWSTEQPALII